MFKSFLLSSVRPFYDAEKEGAAGDTKEEDKKKEVEKQREGIKTVSDTDNEEDDNDENNDDKDDEGEKEKEGEEDKEDEGEEKKEQELSPEQKAIKKLERTIERLQRRVGKTVGERDAIKKELAEAKAALETKVKEGEQPLTEAEVQRRAKELADQSLTEREFNNVQDKLIEDATKIDKNFMKKINDLAEEVAPLPSFMVGALGDLDNGGAVLNYLADNPEDYEDILKQLKKPTKLIASLIKISEKLIEDAKPKPKKISQVPDPPDKIKGSSSSPDILTGKESMEDFVRIRAQQEQARREARRR